MAAAGNSSSCCKQEGPVGKLLSHPGDRGYSGGPSWPLRRRSPNGQQSIANSMNHQNDLLISPARAKSNHNAEPSEYEALMRDMQTMLKKELSETLSSNGLSFTNEPSWVEELRRDMQTILGNEFSEMHSQRKVQFANTNDPFPLLQDIISEIRGLRSIVLQELHGEEKVLDTHSVVVPLPTQVQYDQATASVATSYVSDQCSTPEQSHSNIAWEFSRKLQIPPESGLGVGSAKTSMHASKSSGESAMKVAKAKTTSTASTSKTVIKFAELRECLCTGQKTAIKGHDCRADGSNRVRKRQGLFAGLNDECIKNRVRDEYLGSASNPMLRKSNYLSSYRSSGFVPMVAQHPAFQYVTLAAIILNSAFVAIDTDLNKANSITEAGIVYILADCTFFFYFGVELLIRFMAYKNTLMFFSDAWCLFDAALLALYAFDPFVLGVVGKNWNVPTAVLRLLRLARLFRVTRFLRAFPELRIMTKAMCTALATVGYAILLLGLSNYVSSVAIRSLVLPNSQLEKSCFPNVLDTMLHLILHGTFMDDLTNFIHTIHDESALCEIIVWIYVVVSAMLVMNMLIGIICEVMNAVSKEENEIIAVQNVKEQFTGLLASFDHNGDGYLSWDEFSQLLTDEVCQQLLKKFHVDINALVDLAEDVFEGTSGDEIEVSYRQFIELILDLRWSKVATVKDVMIISKRMSMKFRDMKSCLESIVAERQSVISL